jgi:GYF domain 2
MNEHAGSHWFISLNGKSHGPFTFTTLAKAAANGVVTAETKVWRRGWRKWHPARQVPGLLNETPLAPEHAADDSEWTSLRQSLDRGPTGGRPQRRVRNQPDDVYTEESGTLAVRQTQSRDNVSLLSRFGRQKTARAVNLDDIREIGEYRPADRARATDSKPTTGWFRRFSRRVVITLCAVFLAWGTGRILFASRQATEPQQLKSASIVPMSAVQASGDGLPASVSDLPAVVSLQRNDPASFERFKKRYAGSAVNAQEEEILSLARAAIRKSVKALIAISSGDVLLEITDTYLAYMQALQSSSPESCVALSDESKGAKLTSNLAKEFPTLFVRDMSVLERVASTNRNATIAPPTADQVRPYLDTVFAKLRQQPVKSELLGRDKLDRSEFQPYCALVIAFYQTVLDLPRDDKVNLLRYLYAQAAINADSDLAR